MSIGDIYVYSALVMDSILVLIYVATLVKAF